MVTVLHHLSPIRLRNDMFTAYQVRMLGLGKPSDVAAGHLTSYNANSNVYAVIIVWFVPITIPARIYYIASTTQPNRTFYACIVLSMRACASKRLCL